MKTNDTLVIQRVAIAFAAVWVAVFVGMMIFVPSGWERRNWEVWEKAIGPYVLSKEPGSLPMRLAAYSFIHYSAWHLVTSLIFWWGYVRTVAPLLTLKSFVRVYSLGVILGGWLDFQMWRAAGVERAIMGPRYCMLAMLGFIAFRIRKPIRLFGENRVVWRQIAVAWAVGVVITLARDLVHMGPAEIIRIVLFFGGSQVVLGFLPLRPLWYWCISGLALPLIGNIVGMAMHGGAIHLFEWNKLALSIAGNNAAALIGFIYAVVESWAEKNRSKLEVCA